MQAADHATAGLEAELPSSRSTLTAVLRILASLAAVAIALDVQARTPGSLMPMTDQITAVVSSFKGLMGVAARNLATGEEILVNADLRFPTASAIKTAVMVETYHQAAEGKLGMDVPVTVGDADKVGGSGVLNGMHDGLALTVRDLVHLMIVVSDNTATNLLVNRLGAARINERMVSYGLADTKIFRPTFRDGRADVLPELEREFGLGMATPRDMARLMALIAEGKAVSADASAAMLATLRRQQDRAMIPRLLPQDAGLQIGNKTGTDQEKLPGRNGVRGQVRADAAIVVGKNVRYVVAILTRQVADPRSGVENDALVTGARVSRMVYDHFTR
jgi:beta-lactamase class A